MSDQRPTSISTKRDLSQIALKLNSAAMTTLPVQFRDHCVSELIETESNYVQALNMIINSFAKPLEPLLRREDNQVLFGHIKYFYRIHANFHAELIKAASTTTVSQDMTLSTPTNKISSCFLTMKDKFLKYSEYCASLSKSQLLLEELNCKNEAISAHLDRCQQDAGFKLRDLLSLPVQRILKYHLLLAQLIKNTNDDDEGLKRAHEVMVDLGQYINEVKRDTEAVAIINDIQQSITGPNAPTKLTDYGRLVADGYIRVGTPKQKRYVFIFDKMMLICELNGFRRYHFIESLALADYVIDPFTTSDSKETFQLIRLDKGSLYTFFTKTVEDKNKWIDSIQRAMNNVKPPVAHDHQFSLHTFERASSCDHCGKLLHGLYYQGYKCSVCSCSTHKRCMNLVKPCEPINEEPLSPDSYINPHLEDYPWFCGRLSREKAQYLLDGRPSGTYLVRLSPHNGGYVISLNYNGLIKHMKIHVTNDYRLYLSQNRYFRHILELVAWYEKNSLAESFHMMNAYLTIPFEYDSC